LLQRHLVLVVTIAVVVAALGGALVWRLAYPPAPREPLQGASPENVARAYFTDDPEDAMGLGGPEIVRVDKARPIVNEGYGSKYDSLAQLCGVTICYRSARTDESGRPPGEYDFFVLLGRDARAGLWRVLDSGYCPL
jgi:hypothetical protein